jgi:hypothetical protein
MVFKMRIQKLFVSDRTGNISEDAGVIFSVDIDSNKPKRSQDPNSETFIL